MPLPHRPRTVITGAASGLGRALALELAARRAVLLIADVDVSGSQETLELVKRSGGEAHAVRCDVSCREEVVQLLSAADRLLGGVDVLINNAGVGVSGPVDAIPIAAWEWIMGINLWGAIYACSTFIPRFKEQRSGHILNVASAAGVLCPPGYAPYNVTKAGVVALSESLHAELRFAGIQVTVLCPTFFHSQLMRSGRVYGAFNIEDAEAMMTRSPLQADGVARAAVDALNRGNFYVFPHSDGRWGWRLKRLVPNFFTDKLAPRARTKTYRRPAGDAIPSDEAQRGLGPRR